MRPRLFQAIVTKFLPATTTRPGRIKATASAGSVTVSYEHGLNPDDNHTEAAKKLAEKFGWKGHWYAGGLPAGNGNVFVLADTIISAAGAPIPSFIS